MACILVHAFWESRRSLSMAEGVLWVPFFLGCCLFDLGFYNFILLWTGDDGHFHFMPCIARAHLSWEHGLRAPSEGDCFIEIRLAVNIVHFGFVRLLCPFSCWALELGLACLMLSRASQMYRAQVIAACTTLVWSSL
jgi:hypothetical protein